MVQLVLQRARAGGDDGLQARQQRRHEVGERLAGAGAGLGQQHLARVERIGDRRRQALLGVAGRESVESFRQRTALAEGIAAGLG